MVNQSLWARAANLLALTPALLRPFETPVARNPHSVPIMQRILGILLTVQGAAVFAVSRECKGNLRCSRQ